MTCLLLDEEIADYEVPKKYHKKKINCLHRGVIVFYAYINYVQFSKDIGKKDILMVQLQR